MLRRLLWTVPLIFGITLLTFALFSLSPTDPAEVAARVNVMVPTPELLAKLRHEFGLDLPFWQRYLNWLGSAVAGDFGRSFITKRTVVDEFAMALPATLTLTLTAAALMLAVSVPLGVLSGLREGSRLDVTIRGVVFILSSFAPFWVGLLLISLFSLELGWLPTYGMKGEGAWILPTVTLAIGYSPTYVRLIRTAVISASHENWVVAARAQGMSSGRLTWRLLVNALRPSITALGMSIPRLMAGAFVVESLFAWPGIGYLCVRAIFNRDIPVVQAYLLLMATLFVLSNFLSDVLVLWLDPQKRQGGMR